MRIGLLECDDVAGRFPDVEGGYREMFAALLPGVRFAYYEAHRGLLPASPAECDAWLCTGSKHSVYDGHDWIEALADFIRHLAGAQPYVGICFGHQMLAHAMGGVVERAAQGWGAGVLPVEVLREESWMRPPQREFRIQHMHQDQVQRLPAGAVLLGRSPHCEVSMFRVGDTMLGVEGHPEFSISFGAALIRARAARIGIEGAAAALRSLEQPTDTPLVAQWIATFLARTGS